MLWGNIAYMIESMAQAVDNDLSNSLAVFTRLY
jgi:hypothetical protein